MLIPINFVNYNTPCLWLLGPRGVLVMVLVILEARVLLGGNPYPESYRILKNLSNS